VGRSEQANTFVVDRDLNVLSMVGWVPRVTFFLSDKDPIIIKNIYEFALHSFKSKAVLGLFTSVLRVQMCLSHQFLEMPNAKYYNVGQN